MVDLLESQREALRIRLARLPVGQAAAEVIALATHVDGVLVIASEAAPGARAGGHCAVALTGSGRMSSAASSSARARRHVLAAPRQPVARSPSTAASARRRAARHDGREPAGP